MSGQIWKDGPEAWQERVVLLLRIRYGPTQFQQIPDKDRGDCGLEGFARDGSVYQCYAAQEPLSTSDLYIKQRNKVTKDINKFINNSTILTSVLGPTKISRWVFVVPRWESKELIKHAENKAEEVRKSKLPYVTDDFAIHIVTEDDFTIERNQLLSAGLGKIRVESEEIRGEDLEDWIEQNDILVSTLDGKVKKLAAGTDIVNQHKLRDDFIRHYIAGQNVMEKLHNNYPEFFQAVKQCKTDTEHFLATSSRIPSGEPPELFQKTLDKLRGDLELQVKGLMSHTIDSLVWEAISDWLLRCPLDFPEKEY